VQWLHAALFQARLRGARDRRERGAVLVGVDAFFSIA
jgi:hypothetical protein